MAHVGTVGKRVDLEVTFVRTFTFSTYYGDMHVHKMVDGDGNDLVWKTSAEMKDARKGDFIRIRATVKEHGQYKGEDQTVLTRLKVVEVIEKAPTKEQMDAERRECQLASLARDQFVWRMPYSQYKAHYSDCETVAGSYDSTRSYHPTIEVIVSESRIKPSGTRGKTYAGYCLRNSRGEVVTYRAVSEENAIRRANKEFPGENWECDHIYIYDRF